MAALARAVAEPEVRKTSAAPGAPEKTAGAPNCPKDTSTERSRDATFQVVHFVLVLAAPDAVAPDCDHHEPHV